MVQPTCKNMHNPPPHLFFIVLYTIQIASKQLYSDEQEDSMMQFNYGVKQL